MSFRGWTPEDVARHNARVRGKALPAQGVPEAHPPKAGANKFGARRDDRGGIKFDSKAEARRYDELLLLLAAGEILSFGRQPSFIIIDAPGVRPVRYRADFIVWGKDGSCWVEDVKGYATKDFKIKQKQWAVAYPHLQLRIIGQEI